MKNVPKWKREPQEPLTAAEEAELDAAAVITPEDIEDAMARWREDASPEFRDLLDAKPVKRKRAHKQ